MAAAARADSMLQVPRRRRQRKSDLEVRNPQQREELGRRIRRRQDVPSEAGVTTLILTQTVATPSATFTEVLTLGEPPTSQIAPEPSPSPENTNNYEPGFLSTSLTGNVGMETPIPTSNAARSSMGKTTTNYSPTATAERGSASTTEPAAPDSSHSSGIDIKALVPAIVGGAIFLIIIAFLLGYCIRRRSSKAAREEPDPEAVNEIGQGNENGADEVYGTTSSRRQNEKQPAQATSRNVPDISVDSSHARNRSLSKGTSQSKEGLLQSDYGKLGPTGAYSSENEKRHAMAMFRRSTAQDSATIPHHLRHLRPESVSTDGFRGSGQNHISREDENYNRALPGADRISKIGMALSTSDKSLQDDDNLSAILHEGVKQPEQPKSVFQTSMYFEETPPLYSASQGTYFGAGAASGHKKSKPSSSQRDQPPDFGTVGSGHSSNQSRFAGRSDIATPSPPGTPARSSHDQEPDASSSSRRSSKRGSGIFGLAAATMAGATSGKGPRPKSWDRKSRRWDRRRHSRGRGLGAPTGLEKRKGNKSRSRSRSNAVWTAWFDSSDEGEDDDVDVVEPIPLPGGIVTAKSTRKKRVLFNSTSDISENPTISTNRTLTNSQ